MAVDFPALDAVALDEVPADLLEAAKRAFTNAYALYSRFAVGAALRADAPRGRTAAIPAEAGAGDTHAAAGAGAGDTHAAAGAGAGDSHAAADERGAIYVGANVENASFGLTRCAEQSAVQALVSDGGRAFSEVVVYTESRPPSSPCGACRQVLAEFAPEARVYLVNHRGDALMTTVKAMLPGGFDGSKLPS